MPEIRRGRGGQRGGDAARSRTEGQADGRRRWRTRDTTRKEQRSGLTMMVSASCENDVAPNCERSWARSRVWVPALQRWGPPAAQEAGGLTLSANSAGVILRSRSGMVYPLRRGEARGRRANEALESLSCRYSTRCAASRAPHRLWSIWHTTFLTLNTTDTRADSVTSLVPAAADDDDDEDDEAADAMASVATPAVQQCSGF